MDFLTQLYFECGFFYSVLLVGSFAAGLLYIVPALLGRSKRSARYALLCALLPLAIGLFGTFEAHRAMSAVIDASGLQPTSEELAEGYRIARITTYIGGLFSAILLALALGVIAPCCGARTSLRTDTPTQ